MKYEKRYKLATWHDRRIYFWAVVGLLIIISTLVTRSAEATAPAQSTIDDWSTYLAYVGRSGFNGHETTITSTTASKLKLHWMYHANGAISAQPVETNGMVYWGSWDGYEHATKLSGGQVWATNLGKTTTCGNTIGVASTATVTSASIGGKSTLTVFVGGGDAHFYALDAANGQVLWRTSLGAPPSHFIWSSPLIYKGSVYIGIASFGDCPAVQGQLIQLDTATGAIQHTFNIVPNGCIGGGLWSSPAVDTATDELYIATGSPDSCSTNEVYVSAVIELHASNLGLVSFWQVPHAEWVVDPDFGATPTLFTAKIGGIPSPMVGVIHKNGTYYALMRDALNKGPVWRANIAQGGSNPELGDGSISSGSWDLTRLYVAGGKTSINGTNCPGSVRALDPATGAFIWEECMTSGTVLAPVTGVPGVVVVGAGKAIMVINATTGKTLFVYHDTNKGSLFWGGSSIANGVLYVGNFDGNLYAFGL